jgi:hypothetical protein
MRSVTAAIPGLERNGLGSRGGSAATTSASIPPSPCVPPASAGSRTSRPGRTGHGASPLEPLDGAMLLRTTRAVPVLSRYHEPLLAAARSAGTGLVTGGTDPGRRNITTPLTRSLSGGTGLPRLDTSRLRATWLADLADQLGLATFMHAAGISCSQRLGDLIARLEPAGEAEAVRLRLDPGPQVVRHDPRRLLPLPHGQAQPSHEHRYSHTSFC